MKENVLVVKYETSHGLEVIKFNNLENVRTYTDNEVFKIDEIDENKNFIKELAVISLDNFVSCVIEEI